MSWQQSLIQALDNSKSFRLLYGVCLIIFFIGQYFLAVPDI